MSEAAIKRVLRLKPEPGDLIVIEMQKPVTAETASQDEEPAGGAVSGPAAPRRFGRLPRELFREVA